MTFFIQVLSIISYFDQIKPFQFQPLIILHCTLVFGGASSSDITDSTILDRVALSFDLVIYLSK